MKNYKHCRTFNQFVNFTGMITDNIVIKALTGIECSTDYGGIMACHSTAKKLNKFLKKHKDFHIITVCDTDKGQVFDNCVRFVNRQTYYLGTGSKKPAFFNDRF